MSSYVLLTSVKAFDRVNYWKLFRQLLDKGVSVYIVSLLAYWYSNQHVHVRWRGVLSSSFTVGNGTKQEGVLSPCLFNCYVRDLIIAFMTTKIGCNILVDYLVIFSHTQMIWYC